MSNGCPRCGEAYYVKHHDYDERVEELVRTGREYSCGSVFYSDDDEWLAPDCLRRQLAQKDRELEQASKRADEAEAKMALVNEWSGRLGFIVDEYGAHSEEFARYCSSLDAILADTPEVLVCHTCDNDGDASVFIGPSLPFVGYEIKSGDTVIVLRCDERGK